MASEITVSSSISVLKSALMSSAVSRALSSQVFDMAGNYWIEGTMLVSTSATVIPLGAVTAPGWSWFLNKDATNYLTIRNGSSGADLIKLKPGEPALFPMIDTATPYAIANTASCLMEYAIFSR